MIILQSTEIKRTESRQGMTLIWTDDETAVIYDMKGNANQVTLQYCTCGKEPCVHQRVAFPPQERAVIAHQSHWEAGSAEIPTTYPLREVYPLREAHSEMSLGKAILIYQACSVGIFVLDKIGNLFQKRSTKTVTSGILH